MHLRINQDKARLLGLDSSTLASNLQAMISGSTVAEFREKDKTVGIVFRVDSQNRNGLSQLKNLNVHIGNGKYVPLDQIATISYEAEEGLIWRRDLKPTITVQANTVPGILSNSATKELFDSMKEFRESLPTGYTIELDGPTEMSEKATRWLMQPVPVNDHCDFDSTDVPTGERLQNDPGIVDSTAGHHRRQSGVARHRQTGGVRCSIGFIGIGGHHHAKLSYFDRPSRATYQSR